MELWEIRCGNYYVYNMEEIGIWRQGLAIRLLSKLVYVYSVHVYAMQWYQKAELLYISSEILFSIFNFKLCISLNSQLPIKIRQQIGLFTALTLKPFVLLNAITFLSSLLTLTIKYISYFVDYLLYNYQSNFMHWD